MTHEALVAMAREVCGPFRPERAVDAVGVLAWLAAPGPLVPESERLPLRLARGPQPGRPLRLSGPLMPWEVRS